MVFLNSCLPVLGLHNCLMAPCFQVTLLRVVAMICPSTLPSYMHGPAFGEPSVWICFKLQLVRPANFFERQLFNTLHGLRMNFNSINREAATWWIPANMDGELVLVGTAKARPFRNVWMLEAWRNQEGINILKQEQLNAIYDSHAQHVSTCRSNNSVMFDWSWLSTWFGMSHLQELQIPYTLMPAMPRSSEAMSLNRSGKVPILKALQREMWPLRSFSYLQHKFQPWIWTLT